MRPIWTGSISFGLVAIPVKLYSSTESAQEVRFRLVDSETQTPIKEVRVNPKTGDEIPWERVTRAVEYAPDRFIPISGEELKSLPLPSARTVELAGFVNGAEIDPIYYDKAYYLGPGPGGEKGYVLLREALEEQGKVGLGKVAIRTREHLAAVRPYDGALVLQTLYYADEVRSPEEIPDLPKQVKIQANERKMAEQLIASMEMEFDPAAFKSEYKQALKKLVKAKVEEKPLPEPKAVPKVVDLQEALRQSLERARHERPGERRHKVRGASSRRTA